MTESKLRGDKKDELVESKLLVHDLSEWTSRVDVSLS